MEKYGFIYLWYDRKRKMFYLGSHWGTEDDGYICSSKWMKQTYNHRPEDFKRRILQRNINKEILKEEEHRWLRFTKREELGTRYYNLNNIYTPGSWEKGRPRSEETKQKVSEGLKRAYENGYVNWNKGITHSENTKEKLRKANEAQFADPIKKENHKQAMIQWARKKYGPNPSKGALAQRRYRERKRGEIYNA